MSTPIPSNRAAFSVDELVEITGGTLVRAGLAGASVEGVSTDTRCLTSGNLFVALRGERFDGHEHLGRATEAGATMVLVEREVDAPPSVGVLRVDDTTRALGDLARAHRRRWASLPGERGSASQVARLVVGITGSAGKTTTRRAVAALLSELGEDVHASAGNLNNAIGVPMVLLGLEAKHTIAVVEIGTNAKGEIAHGTSVAEPEVGVLTLVADAHGEGLGTADDVAVEKGALLAALPEEGAAVVNADDPRIVAQLSRCPARIELYAGKSESSTVRIMHHELLGAHGVRITLALVGGADLTFETPLLGVAGRTASALAVATARAARPEAELTASMLTRAFATLSEGQGGRLSPITRADGALVLDDAYNANGASMIASIETAAELAAHLGRRLVLVLGEMYELGEASARVHDEVGEAVRRAAPGLLIAVKGEAARYHRPAERAGIPSELVVDAREAADMATARVCPGDVVLVKGSHGVGLSRVVDALCGREH